MDGNFFGACRLGVVPQSLTGYRATWPPGAPPAAPPAPQRARTVPCKTLQQTAPPVDAPRNLALRHCNCNTATTDDVSVDCTFWSWRHTSVATASPAPLSHTPRLRPRLRAGHGRPIFSTCAFFTWTLPLFYPLISPRLLRHSVLSSSRTVSSLLHHPAVHHGLCHPSQQRCPAGFPPHLRQRLRLQRRPMLLGQDPGMYGELLTSPIPRLQFTITNTRRRPSRSDSPSCCPRRSSRSRPSAS